MAHVAALETDSAVSIPSSSITKRPLLGAVELTGCVLEEPDELISGPIFLGRVSRLRQVVEGGKHDPEGDEVAGAGDLS
jgi:hypothetical protein